MRMIRHCSAALVACVALLGTGCGPTHVGDTVSDQSTNDSQQQRRLGLGFGGRGSSDLSTVGSIEQGGLADQAGMRAGDVILTLNGESMSGYDQSSLGALFRSFESLTFEIERDGDLLVIKIP